MIRICYQTNKFTVLSNINTSPLIPPLPILDLMHDHTSPIIDMHNIDEMGYTFDLEVHIFAVVKLCLTPATLPYSVVGRLLQGFNWYMSKADITGAQPTYIMVM